MHTAGNVNQLKGCLLTMTPAVRLEATNTFQHLLAEPLASEDFEVEEMNWQLIKTEELEGDEVKPHSDNRWDETGKERNEMSASMAEEMTLQPTKIKTEQVQEGELESHSDGRRHKNVQEVKDTLLSILKCPGCPKTFRRNRSGLMGVSHHIMCCHRQNLRQYMHTLRVRYGRPNATYIRCGRQVKIRECT